MKPDVFDIDEAADADASSVRVRGQGGRDETGLAFLAFLEAIPLPAWIYDVERPEILAANDALVTLTGRPRETLIGSPVLDLYDPQSRPAVARQIAELLALPAAAPRTEPAPLRLLVKWGTSVRVHVSSSPAPSVRPRARLAIAHESPSADRPVAADSELVKRARIDAFRADIGVAMTTDEPLPAHFDRVVQAMKHHLDLDTVGVWVLDEASGQLRLQAAVGALDITTANGGRLRFGETWVGRAAARSSALLLDTWDPGMRPLEVACAQKCGVSHVAAFPLVVRRRVLGVVSASRSGPFPEDLLDILRATAAQIAQALGTAFAYEALRISESLSRSILGNMPSALVTLDEHGMIDTANAAAVSLFGYSREEFAGRPFAELFDAAQFDSLALVARARVPLTQWKGRRKNGELFPCELRVFLLDSLRGPGFAAILDDVSERFEIERLKAEFVSVVSHELRTPLTALRGSIGLLTGGVLGELSEEVMEMLHIAERNALRLISLVNDILDLERLQKGKVNLFIEPVRARTIVDRSIESVKAYADQERIVIDVRCSDEVVLGDGDRLVQVLVNLLSNAVKFSPAGSHVAVSTSVESDSVVFRVSDRGRGIPASHQRVIFERFEQVHTSDANEKGGTGLGLAISKAIIEQHDGSIGVESEVGVGSTFWFRVPKSIAPRGSSRPLS